MRDTSRSTAPASLTGMLGGIAEGKALFSLSNQHAKPARLPNLFCRSAATLRSWHWLARKPARVLILDGLGDPAPHNGLLILTACHLDRLNAVSTTKPAQSSCWAFSPASQQPWHHSRFSMRLNTPRHLSGFHRIRQHFQRAVERRCSVFLKVTFDVAVELFAWMQEVWQRGIPLLLSDQFIPNEQMATNQCNSGGEGERARQFC